MRVIVVYESLFGNTVDVATAIAEGIGVPYPDAHIDCVPGRAGQSTAAELLVGGGPTHFLHFLGLSSKLSVRTRWPFERDAETQEHTLRPAVPASGLREWLRQLPDALPGRFAAAFDTRLDRMLSGSAAGGIAKRLRGKGYQMVAQPEGFRVVDMTGPLLPGELARARSWGVTLATQTRRALT